MRLLVILFLVVFVLIGINPVIQKAAVSLRKLLRSAAQRKELIGTRLDDVRAEIFAESRTSRQLNDFEIIMIRRLAHAGGKALSRKQLNAPLLLGTALLYKTLKYLHRRDSYMSGFPRCLANNLPSPKQGIDMRLSRVMLSISMNAKGPWDRDRFEPWTLFVVSLFI